VVNVKLLVAYSNERIGLDVVRDFGAQNCQPSTKTQLKTQLNLSNHAAWCKTRVQTLKYDEVDIAVAVSQLK